MNKYTMKLTTVALLAACSSVGAHETGTKHTHVEGGYKTENGLFISTTDIETRLWDARGKSDAEITKRIEYLVKMADPYTKAERAAFKKYIDKYADTIVIDTIHIGTVGFAGLDEAAWLEMMGFQAQAQKGFTAVSQTATNGDAGQGGHPVTNTQATDKVILASKEFVQVRSAKDIKNAKKAGKTGIFYNIQGSDFIDVKQIDKDVAKARKAGILQANITYNVDNQYGTGGNQNHTPNAKIGLTAAGIELVKAYNKHGIIVDCSHSSDLVCLDIAKHSTKPVMASHSNAYALQPISRNISDEAILAIAKTGGTISVNFLGGFLNKEGDASGEAVAKHVVYIADLISKNLGVDGKKHVGFGADTVHSYADALNPIIRNPERYSVENGYGSVTEQALPTDVWDTVRVLEDDYGWSKEEVQGFLGHNALRVYAANWK